MTDKTCGTCKHTIPLTDGGSFPPEFLECGVMGVEQLGMSDEYYRMYEAFLTDGSLIVRQDFGCILWESKREQQNQ